MVFSSALPGGPALEVADRIVGVYAGDLFRIGGGPVVDDQAAAAHPLQGRISMEAMMFGQIIVEGIPVIDRRWRAEKSSYVHIDQMKSLFQKREVRLRFVAEETRPPYPGRMISRTFGDNYNAMAAVIGEVIAVIIMPDGFLSGNTGRLKPTGKVGDASVMSQASN